MAYTNGRHSSCILHFLLTTCKHVATSLRLLSTLCIFTLLAAHAASIQNRSCARFIFRFRHFPPMLCVCVFQSTHQFFSVCKRVSLCGAACDKCDWNKLCVGLTIWRFLYIAIVRQMIRVPDQYKKSHTRALRSSSVLLVAVNGRAINWNRRLKCQFTTLAIDAKYILIN